MSLNPQAIPPVPTMTAAIAQEAFPRGNRYMTMRDELGVFFTDQAFADLFARRGQPAESPWRLALVLVFQFCEGLSDVQAAEAVCSRIDWNAKRALSLELGDAGFDGMVLSKFRTRLVQGSREMYLVDGILERFKAAGLLNARGRQRTDSTHVLAAVRTLNRLACVGETIRYGLNTLAAVAPDWLAGYLRAYPDWVDRYAHRFDDYLLPKGAPKREALAEQIGTDGRILLSAILAPDAPTWLRHVPAVTTLWRVWMQQYYATPAEEPVHWRRLEDQPAASLIINSPYDIETRHVTKRTTSWVGYKVHITETCDPDQPSLITHVHTTEGPKADYDVLPDIHAALADKAVLPAEHLVDTGYVDAGLLVESQVDH